MSTIAKTPTPPYYAVIFSSLRSDDIDGYAETAARMVELAAQQPGFLGVESVREVLGVTVSYWSDLDSIKRWKSNSEHQLAQKMGMDKWYSSYKIRIARVERDYGNEIKA
ncbi:MAG: antibiotic biosynthesis monooxygenase [Gammaproteobacteria bacterium]|nr:antibiotic biosynthesis monooxygenase [Gammaproteobacteria bacterium]